MFGHEYKLAEQCPTSLVSKDQRCEAHETVQVQPVQQDQEAQLCYTTENQGPYQDINTIENVVKKKARISWKNLLI